jgi:Glycosyl hydrolases family 2, sugar binding domain/Glycosyl hydrolases family 2/Glycosyl hydrolases family 2, TIM barrel domain
VQKLASATNVRPTRIPSSWQSQFTDLRDYAGVAWYWRTLTVAPPAAGQVALLHFGAVDYQAEVYVNDQKAGSHQGGYLPFEIDVTSLLHAGENQVAVRVADPGAKPHDLMEGINYAEIPHGKQDWYVQTSGLWQSVELDYRPRVRLGNARISATPDGPFDITVPVIRVGVADAVRASAEVRDPVGKVVWQSVHDVAGGENVAKLSGLLHAPALWSPQSPNLYELRVSLSSGDSTSCRFGFRSFGTHDGKFYLNGKPLYLRGALDQDFYPETIYTPPSLDYIRDEMRKAKALGLNLLRCHIKVPDPRYLQAADEVGMLVWYEIPNWGKLKIDSEHRAMETLHGMAERDWNHPSVVIVSLINEGWGASLKEAADRAWLKEAYQQAKTFVPWLVVDNSACCDNFHLATDIADFHQYEAIPDYASNFDRLVDDHARRPGWLFSPYGDASPKGDEPLVLSEFGNWGLPRVPEDKPWWFNREFGKREITRPGGVEQRFRDYQYPSLFPDLNALVDATEWHEYTALKYEIEALRARPELQGYVITEFTDVNWEANGLLDMWRHPKVFADALSRLQQDDLLVLRSDKRNYLAGESVHADVFLSHYSPADLSGGKIDWLVEGTSLSGSLPAAPAASAGVAKVGTLQFAVPPSSAPVKRTLQTVYIVGNKTISEDSLNLYFYPPRQPELPPLVSFYDPPGRLRRLINEMRGRNYLATTGSEAYPVLITSVFDDTVKGKLRAGARVILIAADPMTLAPGIEVVPRSQDDFSGNWISDFLWLRKDQAPFTGIGFGLLGEFETQAVTPAAVLTGIPPQNFNDVLAGMFYGWVQSNVGVLVQAKAGKGKLLISTFSLTTAYNSDPYATYLLDAMVNYAVSDFSPRLEIPL